MVRALFVRVFPQHLRKRFLTFRFTLYRLPTMSTESPRITTQTLGVLRAFKSSNNLSGAEIAKVTNLKSGTLYPILFRLERANWLESRWESGEPSQLGRPRRRMYQLTGLGERNARRVYREAAEMIGGLVWELS